MDAVAVVGKGVDVGIFAGVAVLADGGSRVSIGV